MANSIRMNQIISMEEDPELFDFLKRFSKGKPYQARKLMLLGLVQLGRLNGGEAVTMTHQYSNEDIGNEKDEFDLISDAGVGDLF
jgi:hypothetical protein